MCENFFLKYLTSNFFSSFISSLAFFFIVSLHQYDPPLPCLSSTKNPYRLLAAHQITFFSLFLSQSLPQTRLALQKAMLGISSPASEVEWSDEYYGESTAEVLRRQQQQQQDQREGGAAGEAKGGGGRAGRAGAGSSMSKGSHGSSRRR